MRRTLLFVLGCLAAAGAAVEAAPGQPVGLRWRAIGRSSVLEWTAPSGDAVTSYEVRAAPEPIDDTNFAAAALVTTYPSGTPRPTGVPELRELEEFEVVGVCGPVEATCTDGILNGSETDLDCGGDKCPACPDGDSCERHSDCASGVCSEGVCLPSTCTDGICQPVTCTDGVRNGSETDVDCGGACMNCPEGGGCNSISDCESRVCVDDDADPPRVLETALYFAVQALDAAGGGGPVAFACGFELVKLRVKTDLDGFTVILKGRFAVQRDDLDASSGDLRVRLVQSEEVVFDTTIPAAELPPPGKPFNLRNPNADVRRLRVKNNRFGRLEMKTVRLGGAPPLAGVALQVLVDLGARSFEADVTLVEKGNKLVGP